jgi:hypothetical protein
MASRVPSEKSIARQIELVGQMSDTVRMLVSAMKEKDGALHLS